MALTRISSAGIQTSPTFSGDVRIGLGATFESTGNAYVTGITTLGIGATGEVYLYNPSNSALSATQNSVYGWKAKTYCAGLQVNSQLYLSRSGSNGLALAYNNATGSYITANSGFLRVGVPYGGDSFYYGNNLYFKDRLQTKTFAHFQKVSGTEYNTHLYGGDSVIKLSTTNEGVLVSGGATITGNLSIGGTVTYEDVSNVDSIGIITARSSIYVADSIIHQGDTDTKIDFATNQIKLTAANRLRIDLAANHYNYLYGTQLIEADSTNPKPSGSTYVARFRDTTGDNTEVQFFNTNVTNTIISWNDFGNTTTAGNLLFKGVVGGTGIEHARFTGTGSFNLAKDFSVAGVSTFSGNIDVVSTDTGSSAAPEIDLFRNSSSPADADYLGQLKFTGKQDGGGTVNYAKITGKILDASNGTEDGILEFMLRKGGSNNIAARFRSDSLQLLNGTNLTVNGNITLDQGSKIGFSTDSNTFIGQDNLDRIDFNAGGKRLVSINEGTNQPVVIIDKDGVNTGPGNSGVNYNANPHGTELVLGNTSSNNHGMTIVSPSDSYGNIQFSDGSGGGLDATRGSIVFTHSDNKLNLKSKIGSVALTHKDDEKLVTTDTGLDVTGTIDSTVAGADNALTLETTSSGDPKICFNAAGAGGHRIEFLRSSLTLNFTNGTSNRLQISAQGHTLPGINDTYDLGSNTVRWRCTFVDKYVGDADLNVTIGCNAGLGITAASTTACKNIIIGHCAGQRLSTCSNNIFIGSCAGQNAMAPVLVTAIGEKAGQNANATGGTLTAVGAFAGMCNTDGDGNTFIGGHAGRYAKGSSSAYNFYGGYQAGKVSAYACSDSPTGGACNIAIGFNAFSARAGGVNNVILGRYAGAAISTGSNNMAFGNSALVKTVSGGSNFAGGYLTLHENLTGGTNVAIGHAAMRCNISGGSNVAIGYCALALNTCGTDNIALGQCALRCHDTNGGHNFAAGYSALRESEGSHNQVIGHSAGFCNTTGCYNVAIGFQAQRCNTTGCHNISLGLHAGGCNETASDAISIGQHANYCNKAGANIAIGRKASYHDDVATNGFNVAIGDCAFMGGTNMGTRKHNVAIGIMAGGVSTAGSGNVFIGCYSGYCNGGGGTNVYMSRKAGYFNKTGHDNVMIGDCAGFCGGDQNCNIFIGKEAGYCNCGDDNIAIGRKAGQKMQSASNNIFFGPQTGICASTGSNNIGLGFQVFTIANLTGSNNIALGNYTGRRIATGSGNLFLGGGAGRYVLGGCCNVAIGINASYCLSGGNCNIAIGVAAGSRQTASDQNVSIGHKAGDRNCTGSGNVAVGHSAGYGNRGSNNISIGATAGPADSCTNTYDNIFIGRCTGTARTSGCFNIVMGSCAGSANHTNGVGSYNISFGHLSGHNLTTASNTISIGCRAGRSTTCGQGNIYLGNNAAGNQTGGSGNIVIGNNAAPDSTFFQNIIAIGCCSASNGFGSQNGNGGIAIGTCAARFATANILAIGSNAGCQSTGAQNVFIGVNAGLKNTSGCCNSFFGQQTGQQNTTGCCNTFVGSGAASGNTTGGGNISLGQCSGPMTLGASGCHNFTGGFKSGNSLTSGSCNILVGHCAGQSITSGINNIAMGLLAGTNTGIGSENIFVGSCAGFCNTEGRCNVFIGKYAGKCNCTGNYNIAIGDRAGCCLRTGTTNVLIGLAAGMKLCSGPSNIFIGNQTGICASTACENVIMGTVAGKALVGGVNNVALGKMSGCKLNNGSNNVLLGNCSGYCLTGTDNVMLGMNSGFHRSGNKYCRNVLIGKSAGDNATTLAVDNFDILIGFTAGLDYTGSCSIGIGHSVNLPINDGKNQLAIGQHNNNWIVGDCNYNVGIGTTKPIARLDVNVGSSVSAFNIEGSEGQLFSVTNNLSSGSIFAVNDITGLPSIDVDADGTIQLAPRGAGELVGIGTTVPTSKLHLIGNAIISGIITATNFRKVDGTEVGGVAVQSGAPSSANSGDLWYDTDDGRIFIYYNDGSSAQWVDASPNGTPTDLIVEGTTALKGTATTRAIVPEADSTYDIGTSSNRFADVYADTLHGDGSNLTGVQGIPSGGIIMWSGATSAVPSGWVLCDGQNSTPDLRNKFIVGASDSTGDTSYPGVSPGATGGSADATLVSHTHNLFYNHGSFGGSSGAVTPRGTNTPTTPGISGRVSTEGSSATNANLPPYYALAYIMKT